MKKSYETFLNYFQIISFQRVSENMIREGISAPKPESYQLQTQSPNKKFKKSPAFNGKQSFDNRENVYLRTVDIMKSYVGSQETNLMAFVKNEQNFGHLLNKIENLRTKNVQFQILMFLIWRNNKKLIRMYLKLRKQIINRCSVNKIKFNPISLHNQSKYFSKETYELDHIKIDYEYWGFMVDTAKAYISEEMLWWLSDGSRQLPAMEFIKVCIWQHSKQSQENPQLN